MLLISAVHVKFALHCLQKLHGRRIPVDVANHPGLFVATHADALSLAAAHRDICSE